MKNSLKEFKNRFKQVEGRVNLKTRQLKLSSSEEEKKRLKKSEQSLRALWESIKQTNICIVGAPERKKTKRERDGGEGGRGGEREKEVFGEIMDESFPNFRKDIDLQIQECQ